MTIMYIPGIYNVYCVYSMRSKEYVFLGMHTQLLGSTAQDIISNENNRVIPM